jgi:hypothetical protein
MLKELKQNKFFYIVIVFLGLCIFTASYSLSINLFKDGKSEKDHNEDILSETRQTSFIKESGVIVTKDTKLEFLVKYANCLDYIKADDRIDKKIKIAIENKDNLIGLNESQLEGLVKNLGYTLQQFTKNDAIFIKEVPGFNYTVESYFIGIKDNNMVIYKKEKDESIRVVENSIINPRSENNSIIILKDIEDKGNLLETLYYGDKDYQFSNIQDAIEYAQSLCST